LSVGIVSYGHYVPHLRMDMSTVAEQWGLSDTLERIYRLNGRNAVAVNGLDEDTVTLSIEAAERAMALVPEGAPLPRSLMIGSESHPYAVKPSGVIVAGALGLTPDVFTVDLEFACKGGSAALALSAGLVGSNQVESAIAIGADCPQSAPGSLLEASVGSGASAFVLGRENVAVQIDHVTAASSDVTDFWRRDGAAFPSVVGKFSADVGYVDHTSRVVEGLLDMADATPEDFDYVCLHQPYKSLPLSVGRKLGFKRKQLQAGLIAGRIGNTYSSACLLGLCAVLDQAQAGQRILLVSFGSGAGSDGFVLTVTDEIEALRSRAAAVGKEAIQDQVSDEHTDWLTYGQYCLTQGKLRS